MRRARGWQMVAATSRPAVSHPVGGLLALCWAHLLNDGSTNYLPGILPAVLVTVHQPDEMAGVIITVLAIGQMLQPITGRIADRVGGRGLVVLGLAMSSIGGGLIGLAHSLWLLIVLVVLIGVGNAMFHPQALVGVRGLSAGRHGLLTSVFLAGGEIGRGLWPTVASLIVTVFGLAGLWVIAVPGILTLPLLVRAAPATPRTPGKGAGVHVRRHLRPLSLLITYQGIRTLSTYSFVTFIPILWHRRGDDLVVGASVISTMIVVGIAGNLTGGHLTDRIGARPVLVGSAVASGLLLAPTAYLTGPAEWIVAGALGIAFFLTPSTAIIIGQNIFPENRSLGSGIALGFGNGVGAFAVFIVGLWAGTAIEVVFWVLAALSLAAVIPALMLDGELLRRR